MTTGGTSIRRERATAAQQEGDSVASVFVSAWFWVVALTTLVASPALFLSTLVLGAVLVPFGLWRRRLAHAPALLSIALGLLAGSLPYAITAVVTLMQA